MATFAIGHSWNSVVASLLNAHLSPLEKILVVLTTFAVVTAALGTAAWHKRSYQQLQAMQKEMLESRERLLQANAMLSELSIRDGLTGLHNRRHFDDVFDKECRRAARKHRPIAVLLVDIDCFKEVNDTYGHQRGDEYLREVARVLEEFPKRGHDVVARYGGEEFVVLLPEANLEAAWRIADGMRAAVEQLKLEHAKSATGPFVTVSVGVCVRTPVIGESGDHLLRDADAALYVAKHAGRNRVELAETRRMKAVG